MVYAEWDSYFNAFFQMRVEKLCLTCTFSKTVINTCVLLMLFCLQDAATHTTQYVDFEISLSLIGRNQLIELESVLMVILFLDGHGHVFE